MNIKVVKDHIDSVETKNNFFVLGGDNSEYKRERALFGRTCDYETQVEPYKEKPEPEMPELDRLLSILDKALEGNQDEEYGHYLVEKILGFDDDPDSQKIIEEFEAKYFN